MNNPMIFKETNEDGTDYAQSWAFRAEHEFVINCKPQHDKLRNGTIKQQLKKNGSVLICVDGVIEGKNASKNARMYLEIKPEHLLEIGKMKGFNLSNEGVPYYYGESGIADSKSIRKLYALGLKNAYKSLTKEDIEKIYSEKTFHSLVLI